VTPRNLAHVSDQSGAAGDRPRRRADRLLGAPAAPAPEKEVRERPEVPSSVRWAAVVVGLEALLIGAGAVVLLYLTITSTPDSVARAVAEVVFVALGAGLLGAAAVGLARLAGWARGPIVVLQILLGLLALTTAFQAQRPAIGLPVLVLAATVLYLLATPAARLAYSERR
jgi:hypothetical protein